jgi:hypothetical protein
VNVRGAAPDVVENGMELRARVCGVYAPLPDVDPELLGADP